MAQWMCSSKKERETASVCARQEIDSGNRRGDITTTKKEKEGTRERVKATWLRLVERKEWREGGEEVRTAPVILILSVIVRAWPYWYYRVRAPCS